MATTSTEIDSVSGSGENLSDSVSPRDSTSKSNNGPSVWPDSENKSKYEQITRNATHRNQTHLLVTWISILEVHCASHCGPFQRQECRPEERRGFLSRQYGTRSPLVMASA